jgi:hypothetical protein
MFTKRGGGIRTEQAGEPRRRLVVGAAVYDPRSPRFLPLPAAVLSRRRGLRTWGMVAFPAEGKGRGERSPARLRMKAYPVRLNLPAGERGKVIAHGPDPMADYYLVSFCGIIRSEGE